MKVLFDHSLPFALAHGGFQTQIEQTKAALEKRGVEVEYLRWWDDRQTGDLIHYFGRPNGGYIDFAHKKGLKVVIAELHTGLGSRPAWARALQKALMRVTRTFLPKTFTSRLSWDAYRKGDAFIALTEWRLTSFAACSTPPRPKFMLSPTALNPSFSDLMPAALILFAPRLFIRANASWSWRWPRSRRRRLSGLSANLIPNRSRTTKAFWKFEKKNPDWIRYEGAIADRARLAEIYSAARGFVLLSTQESLSLSALEAAAAGCPLLLSDLPWARGVFGSQASYLPLAASSGRQASILADFFKPGSVVAGHFQASFVGKRSQTLLWLFIRGSSSPPLDLFLQQKLAINFRMPVRSDARMKSFPAEIRRLKNENDGSFHEGAS